MARTTRRRRRSTNHKNAEFSKATMALRKMKSSDRYNAIRFANDNFIRNLCSNINKLRYMKLSPQQQAIVKKYKSKLKVLCNRRTSIKKKRQTLLQKGGIGFGLLPDIGGLLSKLTFSTGNYFLNKARSTRYSNQ